MSSPSPPVQGGESPRANDRERRVESHAQPQGITAASGSSPNVALGFLGMIVGSVIAFLLRPSAMLVGQLPFETVTSRGANLQGLDKILVPTAEASFNMLVVGAIIGAVAGVVLGYMISGKGKAA